MLHIRFFGTPEVTLNGQRLAALARSPIPLALLAYLVIYRGQPIPRSRLAAQHWPDVPDEDALHNLSSHLCRLRKWLGDGDCPQSIYLLSDKQNVQFNPAAPFWLGLAEFEAATNWLRQNSRSRLRPSDEATRRLEQAVELYRGDFLEEAHTDWLIAVREQLRTRYLLALEALALTYHAQGNDEAAMRVAQRWLQADPFMEEAHFYLIQLYMSQGRLVQAHAHYQ